MELTKKYIHQNRQKGCGFSQIPLDDDFNVPDAKPDVLRLIQSKGDIQLEETQVTPGHVLIKGSLKFQVLYRSDREEHKIDSLEGELPFQESLAVDGTEEYDTARVRWQMEDLSVGIINSRKLSVRALIQLRVVVHQQKEEEVVTGIENPGEAEIRRVEYPILELATSRKDTWRFKEELSLPSNKPNIRTLLWKQVQLRNVETHLGENQISIQGEALVFALYLGEEEERLEWLETAVPFTGAVECAGADKEQILDMSYEVSTLELLPKPDYDGEQRMLHLELVLDLDICIYREEQLPVLEDMYSVKCRLEPEYLPRTLERLLTKNMSSCKVSQRLELGEGQEGILQLCTSAGSVTVDQVEQTKDGLAVEGTLSVWLLYITTDDHMPLAAVQELIPFHHMVEAPGISDQCRYELAGRLEQMTTTMLDGKQVEVKAQVGLEAIVFQETSVQCLTQVEEMPLDLKELQERPGMVGYIARPGERLWDIAKENFTTVAEIRERNQLGTDTLKGGEKLLMVKQVG